MAELFGKDVRTVNEHIGDVFDEGELEKEGTIRKFRIARLDGVPVEYTLTPALELSRWTLATCRQLVPRH